MTTYNMDLAEDALEAAETYTAPRITDESDQTIAMDLNRLFVGRKNVWTAQRLLKSTGRVGTPNKYCSLFVQLITKWIGHTLQPSLMARGI